MCERERAWLILRLLQDGYNASNSAVPFICLFAHLFIRPFTQLSVHPSIRMLLLNAAVECCRWRLC